MEATAAGDRTLEEAIAWAVRLASGTATAQDRSACEQWRSEHAAHEQAWQRVQAVEQTFHGAAIDSERRLAQDTLVAAERLRRQGKSRRRAIGVLGWGVLTLGLGSFAARWLGGAPWLQGAQYATRAGERRRVAMRDGGSLALNSGTEVELRFSLLRRRVVLQRGEVFISTGADADSFAGRRAFWVETPAAHLEALGTRFDVRVFDAGSEGIATRLQVTEGRVAVHPTSGASVTVAEPGDTLLIPADGSAPRRLALTDQDATAWTEGVLVAKQMRLDAFTAELGRHRAMPLRCDPSVAALRVSGVFQLDGPEPVDRALAMLARTLPVAIENQGAVGQVVVGR
ncbi:FecR family protein [Roseateles sp.]|uniref:FecR family protein n=1 Tax=Roseateles sp. TaxID=1971397 RepID=UPI0039E9C2FF